MYQKSHKTKNGISYIELFDNESQSKATISPDQGGSLLELRLDNSNIIANMHPLTYEDTYASSILFPFANRVANGEFVFEEVSYKLDCNEQGRSNALHGLVFDKRFELEDSEFTSDFGSVTLYYESDGTAIGFPFKYGLRVTYTLKKSKLTVSVGVQNLDTRIFPFTLGWHPYFATSNLYNSYLVFKSSKKIRFNEHLITSGFIDYNQDEAFQIKDSQLDDCYELEDSNIEFITPEYKLKINTSSSDNFLQLYTPDKPNVIAIEPMTGVSDSLNNGIGLQTLSANESYSVDWNIEIEK